MFDEGAIEESSCQSLSAPQVIQFKARANHHKKLFLLLSTATFFGCHNLKGKSDIDMAVHSDLFRDMAVLKNLNVKSVVETKYSADKKSGELVKGDVKYSEEMIFNDERNSIELNSHNSVGTLNWKRTYTYYNDKLTEVRTDSSDGSLFSKIIYWYDNNRNLQEINEYNADDTPLFKTLYWFDKDSNMLVINEYSCYLKSVEEGGLHVNHERRIAHKVDDEGNRLESTYSKNESIIVSKNHYKYDDTGCTMTEERVLEETVTTDHNPSKIIYRYDKEWRLLEKTEYALNGQLSGKTTCRYKFDEHNVWTERVEFFALSASGDGTAVMITERDIQYGETPITKKH